MKQTIKYKQVMSNKTEKLKEVIAFIKRNQDKDLTWIAENNGIVSRMTFFNWKKKGLLSTSTSISISTSTSAISPAPSQEELIDDIFEQHRKKEESLLKAKKSRFSRKRTISENEELKKRIEELEKVLNEKDGIINELRVENQKLKFGMSGESFIKPSERQEYVEHTEPETRDEDFEDPWDKVKAGDIKSVLKMKETTVPSEDDLNTVFERFQKELEVRGTHKKMKPVFETDSSVSSLSGEESFNLEKIITK